MANVDARFGFRPIRRLDGSAWSGNLTQLKVANGDSSALNRGDCVKQLATGYVTVAAAGITDHSMRGVFMGCHYLSSALGYPIWSNYWPGSGATGDVDVFVCDDPFVVYEVQGSTSTAIAFADIGANADVVVTASTTGFSKWAINQATLATTATFPWRIIALGNNTRAVENGYDSSTGFNIVEVAWNDMFLTQKTGLL
jgi:hypothetical protein